MRLLLVAALSPLSAVAWLAPPAVRPHLASQPTTAGGPRLLRPTTTTAPLSGALNSPPIVARGLRPLPYPAKTRLFADSGAASGEENPNEGGLKLGDKVRVCWPTKDDAEYNGMLTHMFDDGTYGIVYSLDETYEQGVSRDRVSKFVEQVDESFIRPLPGELLEDVAPQQPGDGDETSEELLARYRGQMQDSNDNWQFSCMAEVHGESLRGAAPEAFLELSKSADKALAQGEGEEFASTEAAFAAAMEEAELGAGEWRGLVQTFLQQTSSRDQAPASSEGGDEGASFLVEVVPPGAGEGGDAADPKDRLVWEGVRSRMAIQGEAKKKAQDGSKKVRRGEAVPGVPRTMEISRAALAKAVRLDPLTGEATNEPPLAGIETIVLGPLDFRPAAGNQVCGQAFVSTRVVQGEGGEGEEEEWLELELAVRNGAKRIRIAVAYAASAAAEKNGAEASGAEGGAEASGSTRYPLRRISVAREALGQWPNPRMDSDLFGPPGEGLFDAAAIPAGAAGLKYRFIPLAGSASVVVPAELVAGEPGVLCLDWAPQGSKMRYQVDRKFADGAFASKVAFLEVTEVLADQAAVQALPSGPYAPLKGPFPPKPVGE